MIKHTPYVPDMGIEYPVNEPDKHILGDDTIEKDTSIDEHYPFIDKSFKYRFHSTWLYYFLACCCAFPLQLVKFGLKIEGKEHLHKNKKLFKNGAITISNHVLRWDFVCVLQALRPKRPYVIVWKNLMFGKDKWLVKHIRGIPIPETKGANIAFMRALDSLHQKKKWLHVFPESANWHYFQPIRPFKSGAFVFAHKFQVPIIPMAFSYRKPTGFFKFIGIKSPLITLHIGEPLFADRTLDRKTAINRLLHQSHEAMCKLAGIEKNMYPATFEEFSVSN
ncbi:MAG: 1-acyl-sn-glycerol-3-phosphate acyltransferase [Prevotellaceae bacterium]|jgi:1-acyl-sn-glycerol-3-phosphate acyltransferase|nr:1-acyl-sn-glycerol-3-phosphate acyltransferase [Prevotellaceae bacterium]